MSWLDKIQNDLIITTGDGKQYKPSWLNASKKVEYNYAEFDFPEVSGTLVKRSKPRGKVYNIELYFQGDDHLDIATEFNTSADNPDFWVLEHPFYGFLPVQPTTLEFDNTDYNISKISGSVIETITEDNPLLFGPEFSPVDNVELKSTELAATLENVVNEGLAPEDVNSLSQNNSINYRLGVPIIKLPAEFEQYYGLFNTANTFISTAIASPLLAIRATIAVIQYPALFTTDAKTRINLLIAQFNTLRNNVSNFSKVSSKQVYQVQGSASISALCVTAATPLPGNYTNSVSVMQIVDTILSAYNTFLLDLDNLQSSNGGNPTFFVPDAQSIIDLNNLVNFTISNLFSIALNARKERSLILNYDTNIVVLTHRLYGLDPTDANIDELIANNNFSLEQLLTIKKNTKVLYYI